MHVPACSTPTLLDPVHFVSYTGRVLVLERMEAQRCVRVSRKPSLLAAAAAGQLPRRFEDVTEAAVVPGSVASVTHDAVYVRFLGGLTGGHWVVIWACVGQHTPHQHTRCGVAPYETQTPAGVPPHALPHLRDLSVDAYRHPAAS